jgi:glycosyltransferase involved in cell wall biosynthesis
MTNICFILAYTIYPKRGGLHEQVYLLSSELRRRGYNVYILYYRHGLIRKSHTLKIPLYLSGVHPKLYAPVNRCDHIVIETAWPWLATIPIHLMGKDFVLHLHSIESLPGFGLSLYKRLLIRVAESVAGRLARKILSVSNIEYSILRSWFGDKVRYIPLAVDLEERRKYIKIDKRKIREFIHIPVDKSIISFVGGMSYEPNREAAKIIVTRIAPKVRKIIGSQALFLLIGADPPLEAIGLDYVRITGYVKSIAPYIAASDICIAPIYKGGGVKMKVLDCMSLGRPVIATNKAVEGIPVKPWIHYIPAETPEDFIEEIVDVVENLEYFNSTIGKAGYSYVTKHHSLDRVIQKFLKELENE